MNKKDLKIFLGIVLREHPDVFPSSVQIRKLLRKYGIRNDARTVLLTPIRNKLKARWIENCSDDGKFLECINKHGMFSHTDDRIMEMIHKRFVSICERLCAEKEMFPASNKIAALIKERYNVNISDSTVAAHLDLQRMQKEWVKHASCMDFLTACSKSVFSSVHQSVKLAANNRFQDIVKEVLPKDEFPTIDLTARTISKKYGINVSRQLVRNHIDIKSLQEEWIKKSSTKTFLQNLKSGKTRCACLMVKEKIEERFATVCSQLFAEKKIFPTYCAIVRLLMEKYNVRMKDTSISEKLTIEKLQIDWIRTAGMQDFLNVLKTGRPLRSRKKVRDAVNERFVELVRQLFQKSDKFPTFRAISESIFENHSIKVAPTTIALLNVIPIQIEWIKTCSDKALLRNLHIFERTRLRPEVKMAVDSRIGNENRMKEDYREFVRRTTANKLRPHSSISRCCKFAPQDIK